MFSGTAACSVGCIAFPPLRVGWSTAAGFHLRIGVSVRRPGVLAFGVPAHLVRLAVLFGGVVVETIPVWLGPS